MIGAFPEAVVSGLGYDHNFPEVVAIMGPRARCGGRSVMVLVASGKPVLTGES
jgi:hypothetical protein